MTVFAVMTLKMTLQEVTVKFVSLLASKKTVVVKVILDDCEC